LQLARAGRKISQRTDPAAKRGLFRALLHRPDVRFGGVATLNIRQAEPHFSNTIDGSFLGIATVGLDATGKTARVKFVRNLWANF
jgi:hypothetical protein